MIFIQFIFFRHVHYLSVWNIVATSRGSSKSAQNFLASRWSTA